MNIKVLKKPELLAPAGSMEALDAAICAGADAVYFGTSSFNARINAINFDCDGIKRAIEKCKNYGVRSNITFNTLIYDRELEKALEEVGFLYECGADALIVADIGLASLIRKHFPDIELHASTQMSIHSTDGACFAEKQGFSRAVIARELDRDSIKYICENSPIEIEIFIHGALCVSHSGQCLFSSMVGARSGNRGECAQPCRLPYSGSYPLSLKDNCLAGDFNDVLTLGAAALKIEGRMKSPSYVYGVTSVYRRLIDEERNANAKEYNELAALFSRSGFTNGYYIKKLDFMMNGIRTECDKAQSVDQAKYDIKDKRKFVNAHAVVKKGVPSKLTLSICMQGKEISACASGFMPEDAKNAPLTEETLAKNLLKFGSSDFNCDPEHLKTELDSDLIIPVSKINELRRDAISALEAKLNMPRKKAEFADDRHVFSARNGVRSARFLKSEQITDKAGEYFDIIYLPLSEYDEKANGVVLPPVVFDNELDNLKLKLMKVKEAGAKYALVSNIGQIEICKEAGFICYGDFRFNVANMHSAGIFDKCGLEGIIPSVELTLAKLRDMDAFACDNTVIYGRIPLMLLEKCAIKEISGCEKCFRGEARLKDRMGEFFPVFKEGEHRNIVYNSRVTYMADRQKELVDAKILHGHFIFTTEKPREIDNIIDAYKKGRATELAVRRIARK